MQQQDGLFHKDDAIRLVGKLFSTLVRALNENQDANKYYEVKWEADGKFFHALEFLATKI